MRRAVPAIVAAGCAFLGALNLGAAVELGEHDALRSPDAWLPLTASMAGWLVLRLSPRNTMGWLLLAVAASSATFGGAALAVLGGVEGPATLLDAAAWLSAWAFLPSYLISFLLIPLLFPNGHLPSPHWRPVMVLATGVVAGAALLLAFGSRDSIDPGTPNPWRVAAVSVVLDRVETAIWISIPVMALAGVLSLGHRFLVTKGADRRAVAVLAITGVAGVLVLVGTGSGLLVGLLLPLVVASAAADRIQAQLEAELALSEIRAAELRASRARITRTYDNARRRIERDLHDGAQQGLLALAMGLGRAQSHSEGQVRDELAALHTLAQRTLVELRELASGTYPSALRELGIGAALRETVGASINLHDTLHTRPHEETEAAVYFASLEAITNARKHADASTIAVTLEHTDRHGVRFTVVDDGIGLDVATSADGGTGITNMADRLGARGGGVELVSEPGRGTTVVGVAYDEPR